MNHIEFGLNESRQAVTETEFEKWAREAEAIMRHDLDGDETIDGYSLDSAFDAFERGFSPEEYARGRAWATITSFFLTTRRALKDRLNFLQRKYK